MEKKIALENLFILDIAVLHLTLESVCDCALPASNLCVVFEFLNGNKIEICQKDFNDRGCACELKTKSFAFSMTENEIEHCLKNFTIFVTVIQRANLGWVPTKAEVAMTRIDITDIFCKLVAVLICNKKDGTQLTGKILEDEYDVEKLAGGRVGKLGVIIKLYRMDKKRIPVCP